MSAIDITEQLTDVARRAAALQLYEEAGLGKGKDIRLFNERQVKVKIAALPQVGMTHPDGLVYTYCLSIKTVMTTFIKSGNLGRFASDERASEALTNWLETLAQLDLRNVVKYLESPHDPKAIEIRVDELARELQAWCRIPGADKKWHWLTVKSELIKANDLPQGELVKGNALTQGEPALLNALFMLCRGLEMAAVWDYSSTMSLPGTLQVSQTLTYYHYTASPDAVVVLTLNVSIPKANGLHEIKQLLEHIR